VVGTSDDTRRRAGFAVAWVVAAVAAITVGVTAVNGLGDRIRDRGPLGDNELVREALLQTGTPTLDPDEPLVEATFTDDFGEFAVACRGKWALGIEARPDREAGWRTISFEQGPDDDVDAVFSDGRRSQELEIYCNLGRPVLELENNVLPDD
jgi:hypothetical protein